MSGIATETCFVLVRTKGILKFNCTQSGTKAGIAAGAQTDDMADLVPSLYVGFG